MRRAADRFDVGFVGGGNMAAALVAGIVEAGVVAPGKIGVSEPDGRRRSSLRRRHGVGAADGNVDLVERSTVVILAVKPQILPDVLAEIGGVATRHQLFVSIAAGFPIRKLEKGLGPASRVIRVMPNTPALVGRGVSAIARGRRATAADEKTALRLFRAVGDALALPKESALDAVTATSGSGPAFVYRFAEALIEGARRQGLDRRTSERLVFGTISGAAAMMLESGQSPAELREMVSSPGGTTLAGLGFLDERDFMGTVSGAVAAATHRSKELGKR